MPRISRGPAVRAAFAVLAATLSSPLHAGVLLHGGPLRVIGDEIVECNVVNIRPAPVDEIRVRIFSDMAGIFVSDVTCNDVPQWLGCRATFSANGATFLSRASCVAESGGKKDTLRGVLQRWSPNGLSDELVLELR